MPEKRSEKSRFQSRFGGGFVSDSQYITEILCIIIASQEKKDLFDHFWRHSPWDKIFRTQVTAAGKLLQKWDIGVVVAALKDYRCNKIKSFRAAWLLEPILKEKQREILVKQEVAETIEVEKSPTDQLPRRPSSTKQSLLSKLRGI